MKSSPTSRKTKVGGGIITRSNLPSSNSKSKTSAPGEESGFEKKMKLQTDCREIMKRVNRITEDFQNMISTGLPVSSSTSTLPNDSNFLPQSQSRSSKFHKPEPPTVAELQFLEYQANKPTVTTLFIDHEKMGLEKQKVLNSLKEWFYFENNKYQNSSSSTSDSEEEYDIYQDSYITSLRDQTKDVASAARNIGLK